MDRLRESILCSRTLDAQQEIDELCQDGAPVQGILATLYECATRHQTTDSSTPHGLVLVYNLDRWVHELGRIGALPVVMRHVARTLAADPKQQVDEEQPPVLTVSPPESLEAAIAAGETEAVAAWLMGLEEPRQEVGCRHGLFDLALAHLGRMGHTLIFANAFLHGFERVARNGRVVLARHAARYLLDRVAESDVSPAHISEPPPLPGESSAGALLTGLRQFNRPAALGALFALRAGRRDEEAFTVLLLRAEENAGPMWHNLVYADAARECLEHLPDEARQRLLSDLTERLLHHDPDCPIVEGLNEGIASAPLRTRERITRQAHLADSLARCDRDEALSCARQLLYDEEGADRIREAVATRATRLLDPHAPHAFTMTATCCAIARHVGWPAARGSLLRAVHALATERFD